MTPDATRPRGDMEAAVADYLAAHPDFLHRHPELATELTLPHPVHAKTVSLVERQVSLLREQKLELKRELHHLAQVARENETLLHHLQGLTLDLIDSGDLATVLHLLDGAMRRDFCADAVVIWLFGEAPAGVAVARSDARVQPFQRILDQARPVCGALRPEQLAALFGESTDIASAALIPLLDKGGAPCVGLLATGSRNPRRYHAEMGTAFLAHLGQVAGRVIRARLAHGT